MLLGHLGAASAAIVASPPRPPATAPRQLLQQPTRLAVLLLPLFLLFVGFLQTRHHDHNRENMVARAVVAVTVAPRHAVAAQRQPRAVLRAWGHAQPPRPERRLDGHLGAKQRVKERQAKLGRNVVRSWHAAEGGRRGGGGGRGGSSGGSGGGPSRRSHVQADIQVPSSPPHALLQALSSLLVLLVFVLPFPKERIVSLPSHAQHLPSAHARGHSHAQPLRCGAAARGKPLTSAGGARRWRGGEPAAAARRAAAQGGRSELVIVVVLTATADASPPTRRDSAAPAARKAARRPPQRHQVDPLPCAIGARAHGSKLDEALGDARDGFCGREGGDGKHVEGWGRGGGGVGVVAGARRAWRSPARRTLEPPCCWAGMLTGSETI